MEKERLSDSTRVTVAMRRFLSAAGYDVPTNLLEEALKVGLQNGPTYVYDGKKYQEGYVLYVP